MWLPGTERDILSAIANGTMVESASFDAKAMLPPKGKNKDLAKDVCAMTVDGGVLLYGLAGDDPTRPDTPMPFDRAGAAERIDQVSQNGIDEPPEIEIRDIDSETEPGNGYLVVVIPASPRAPHMVTLDGDNRYWGRGATGNRLLTQAEIERLYVRRERWEIDRRGLLTALAARRPLNVDASVSVLTMFARPVSGRDDLLQRAAGTARVEQLLRELRDYAQSQDPQPRQGNISLVESFQTGRKGSDLWTLEANRTDDEYGSLLEINQRGEAHYWNSPMVYERGNRLVIFERNIARAAGQITAATAWLYQRAGYVGMVDFGLAVDHLIDAYSVTVLDHFGMGQPYGAPEYLQDMRVTMLELSKDPVAVAKRLLRPLTETVAVAGYDPFDDRP